MKVFRAIMVEERAREGELRSAVETWIALGIMEVKKGLVVMRDFQRHKKARAEARPRERKAKASLGTTLKGERKRAE